MAAAVLPLLLLLVRSQWRKAHETLRPLDRTQRCRRLTGSVSRCVRVESQVKYFALAPIVKVITWSIYLETLYLYLAGKPIHTKSK